MWEEEESRRQKKLWALLFLLLAVFAFLCEVLSELVITGEASAEVAQSPFQETRQEEITGVTEDEVEEYLRDRPLVMVTGASDDWFLLINYGNTKTDGRNVRPAIVQIRTPEQSGSGIILEVARDRILLSTCGHVIGGNQEAEVSFFDGESVTGKLWRKSDGCDIAFLEVKAEEIPAATRFALRSVRTEEEAWEELAEGEEVFLLASVNVPAGDYYEGYAQYKEIYVPEFGCMMFCCRCEPVLGMSGGGIFDREGNLVAMVNGGTDLGQVVGLSLPVMLGELR